MTPARAAAVLVAVLLASSSGRGLCFMPEPARPAAPDAHGCCRPGFTAGAPECCMASASDEGPARAVALPGLAAPSSAAIAFAPAPALPRRQRVRAAGPSSHSPPPSAPLRV